MLSFELLAILFCVFFSIKNKFILEKIVLFIFYLLLYCSLSITKIVLGLLSVAVGIATCALNSPDIVYYSLNGYIGTGIWCGVISIATGAVGVTAANTNTFIRVSLYMGDNKQKDL